ncbi:MAG: tryptophan synthase subunit alpha [Pirellulales bacterium]|nr:tryptophan synthase subunit alpha [Pirellulales bacterium]
MSAIDQVFARLKAERRKAFIPFVTAGDPDLAFTADVLRCLARHGASLCEVGVPYSDPIADGPVIQDSYARALAHKIRVADILATLREATPQMSAPTVTMVSYAIIHRYGPERFVADAQAAGIAGAIVPDLLVEEAGALATLCRQADFSLIQLVTPTTPRERAVRIAESSTGFVYYVSVTGITGERTQLPPELLENVAWLRERTSLPICIGFGISQPEHVRLLAPAADGVIVGSAIVRRVGAAQQRPRAEVLDEIGRYVDELVAALPLATR